MRKNSFNKTNVWNFLENITLDYHFPRARLSFSTCPNSYSLYIIYWTTSAGRSMKSMPFAVVKQCKEKKFLCGSGVLVQKMSLEDCAFFNLKWNNYRDATWNFFFKTRDSMLTDWLNKTNNRSKGKTFGLQNSLKVIHVNSCWVRDVHWNDRRSIKTLTPRLD